MRKGIQMSQGSETGSRVNMNVSEESPTSREIKDMVINGFIQNIEDGKFDKVVGYSRYEVNDPDDLRVTLYFSDELYKKEVVNEHSSTDGVPSGDTDKA